MKNYKQILEAINKGIKFALDDFEDQDDLQGQVNSKVKYQDGTKEYLDLINEVVDLGLPSGTLWCKYNLGADCGNTPESWYGEYYAWGELEGNKTSNGRIYFSWGNYKFVVGKKFNKLTKYCNDPKMGLNNFTDNLTKLLSEDDAAYQNKHIDNYKFHIPTKEQCEELIKYTSNYWVRNYDPNKLIHNPDDEGIKGLNGYIFEGKNQNQMFIPAAGYCNNFDLHGDRHTCCLWSSSLHHYLYCTWRLYFNPDNIRVDWSNRCDGFSIRPVLNL